MSIHGGGGAGAGERHGQRRAAAGRSRVAGARIAAALSLAAALTACTADADDAASPSPTTAPTVSASATPVASATPTSDDRFLADGVKPDRPAALDEGPSVDGAIAVATYYLSLYGYVYNTHDVADWQTLSHADCIFCTSVLDNVEAAAGAGGWSEGGSTRVSAATATEVEVGSWFHVHLTLEQAPSRDLDVSGTVIDESAGGTFDTHAVVLFEDGVWKVREVTPTKVEQ